MEDIAVIKNTNRMEVFDIQKSFFFSSEMQNDRLRLRHSEIVKRPQKIDRNTQRVQSKPLERFIKYLILRTRIGSTIKRNRYPNEETL
jgi:hypothetical protein